MSKLMERHRLLQEATELAITETAGFDGLASDILTNVVIHTINKYQQKLGVGIQDSVSDLIENFKQQIAESIFATARGWRVANRESFLFPRSCRFCFTKGESTIFIIEQEPQIRTLLFDSIILESRRTGNSSDNAERIALAMPYVEFIIHFRRSTFSGIYCAWRTQPLRGLDDGLNYPVLPNIHDNLNICTGMGDAHFGQSMTEQVDGIIAHFWNSKFNNDLSSKWWEKGQIDPRLGSARIWSENSLEDPTFILQTPFQSANRTVQQLIDVLVSQDHEPDETSLRHQLTEAIDNSVNVLGAKMLKYFKKTKFEKFHPKEIKDSLSFAMKNSATELNDVLFSIQHELEVLKNQINCDNQKSRASQAGPMWNEYWDGNSP